MKPVLQKIVSNPNLEARWLNTLSLLEFIGSQKIAKTVCHRHPSIDILEHYDDETHHAHLFKKLAITVCREASEDYLCRDQAISYFQMLDHAVTEWLTDKSGEENSYHNYLLVTSQIERRAMKIYPIYQKLTQHPEVKKSLNEVILQEANHRGPIDKKAAAVLDKIGEKDSHHCQVLEENLFELFVSSLTKELTKPIDNLKLVS